MFLLPAVLAAVVVSAGCGEEARDPEACSRIEGEAREFLAAFQACDPGDACRAVNLFEMTGKNCLCPLQCAAAVRDGADLTTLAREADQFVDRSHEAGCACNMDPCPENARARCNAETRRCELVIE